MVHGATLLDTWPVFQPNVKYFIIYLSSKRGVKPYFFWGGGRAGGFCFLESMRELKRQWQALPLRPLQRRLHHMICS